MGLRLRPVVVRSSAVLVFLCRAVFPYTRHTLYLMGVNTLRGGTSGEGGVCLWEPDVGVSRARTNRLPLRTACLGHGLLSLSVAEGQPTWKTGANISMELGFEQHVSLAAMSPEAPAMQPGVPERVPELGASGSRASAAV